MRKGYLFAIGAAVVLAGLCAVFFTAGTALCRRSISGAK
jgi:hypothetical protein